MGRGGAPPPPPAPRPPPPPRPPAEEAARGRPPRRGGGARAATAARCREGGRWGTGGAGIRSGPRPSVRPASSSGKGTQITIDSFATANTRRRPSKREWKEGPGLSGPTQPATMPAGHGVRARTRDLFSRAFRKKGFINLTTYLRNYKLGDCVDIKVNSAVHSGMPFKWYHGKTGVVWNVTKRAVGVEVNKEVCGRILKKRIHVRVEHISPSRCREEFLLRRADNDARKAEAKKRGEKISTKRQPLGPREGFAVSAPIMETVTAIPYDIVKEGLKGF
mmetsp:Transcript_24894/g.78801  ORF Transcript_24894/g.78801 Transcript_24894/m.78801 type:complete len:277 (+) Transcript_24894:3405-4235(+)